MTNAELKRLYNQNLISFVRDHPILYNKELDEYKDSQRKSVLWRSFGKQQCPPQSDRTVRANWNTLRTNYSRAKRSLSKRQPVEGTSMRQWEYYDSMRYLDGIVIVDIMEGEMMSGNSAPKTEVSYLYDDDIEIHEHENSQASTSSIYSDCSKSPEALKRSTSFQEPKKKKMRVIDESEMYLKSLGAVLNNTTDKSQVEVKELVTDFKKLSQQIEKLVNDENAASLFLRSLKPLLAEFEKKDKKAFAVVCNRIQTVFVDALNEFEI